MNGRIRCVHTKAHSDALYIAFMELKRTVYKQPYSRDINVHTSASSAAVRATGSAAAASICSIVKTALRMYLVSDDDAFEQEEHARRQQRRDNIEDFPLLQQVVDKLLPRCLELE